MMVTEPHECWMVRVRDHFVFLTLNMNGEERAPRSEWHIKKLGGRTAQMTAAAWWTFQEFGFARAFPVHIVGADRHNSLVGRDIAGIFSGGKRLKGFCISLVGESAVLSGDL